MYTKINLIILFSICFSPKIFGQILPDFINGYNYGGSSVEYPQKIKLTLDSTFIQVGNTWSNNFDVEVNKGNSDYWIIETDSLGEILNEKTFGGSSIEICYDFLQTIDSGFIFVGYSYSDDGDISGHIGSSDFWIVRTNKTFDIIWEHTFGGTDEDRAFSIFKSQDNNFLIGGISYSDDGNVGANYGGSDFWLIKIDITGELIWSQNYGGSENESLCQILQNDLGNIFLIGDTYSSDGDIEGHHGNSDYFVLKADEDGNLVSTKCFGGSNFEKCNSAIAFNSNIVLVGRISDSDGDIAEFIGGVYDIWTLCINFDNEILWQNTLGGTRVDEGYSIAAINENELLICGYTTSNDVDVTEFYSFDEFMPDYWVVNLDSLGNVRWQISLGGGYSDFAKGGVLGNNGIFYISGYVGSNDIMIDDNYGAYDIWLAKINPCIGIKYFYDEDEDGFGDISSYTVACTIPLGYVTDSTDCNDTNPDIKPTLADICNAIDDNCNGITDEDAIFITYYLDNDGDLFGNDLMDSTYCNVLIDYVENNLDCNDENPEINPLAAEICNAIDDNCNTDTDEGLVMYTLYADADSDTYGNPDAAIDTCIITILGYVSNSLDCDDTNPDIFSGATEICNYLDDDCDGVADDSVSLIQSFEDADGDTYGNALVDSISCELPFGFVLDTTDCDDTNPNIYPGAVELLNGLDDDCDQITDEDLPLNDILNNTISIYPNPATNILFIQSNANYNITILNQLGEEIQHKKLFIGLNTIAVTDFASGMYWVNVENGEMVVWIKE